MSQKENKLILYKDDEGKLSVNTLFADEDVWLTQAQLVEIYQSSKSNISEHLKNIFEDKELDKEVVVRKFRTTTQHGAIEGKTQTHEVLHSSKAVVPYRIRKPSRKQSVSLKSIANVKCACLRVTSTRLLRRCWRTMTIKRKANEYVNSSFKIGYL